MRKTDKKVETLLDEMREVLGKTLPKDSEFKALGLAPMSAKDRREWQEAKLEILNLLFQAVMEFEKSSVYPLLLTDIADVCELTSERIRQIERDTLKKIRNNLPSSEYNELLKAFKDHMKNRDKQLAQFNPSGGKGVDSQPYKDPNNNGKAYA